MEVERSNLTRKPSLPPAKPARTAVSAEAGPVRLSESSEGLACRLLFRRLPELLSRLISSSEQAGQVTLVFRLGYFDLAALSQARKDFFQETRAGLRFMVEIPDQAPRAKDQPGKPSTQIRINAPNLKRLARRLAAQVRTERWDRAVGQTSTTAMSTTVTTPRPEATAVQTTSRTESTPRPLQNQEGRTPLTTAQPRRWLQLTLKEKKRPRPQPAPDWLKRREEQILRQERPDGPQAAQNTHSAERQPYCLCPGCGREMESTLLCCPECTMRAARTFQVPSQPRRPSRSLIWLLSQVVSCG